MLFLHGILGTRANWRGVARALVDQRPGERHEHVSQDPHHHTIGAIEAR